MRALDQEGARVLLFDSRKRPTAVGEACCGSLNTPMIRAGGLFHAAAEQSTASIIVAHNDPAGGPAPSAGGVAVTRRRVEAGRWLDPPAQDRILIGRNRSVSLPDRGSGFS